MMILAIRKGKEKNYIGKEKNYSKKNKDFKNRKDKSKLKEKITLN
jgi:hypothetical protein